MSKVKSETKAEPKKRASRAKKQPTREEALKLLLDTSNELKQIIVDLKEDEIKVSSMQLKKIPELIKETLANLDEDQKEVEEQYNELLNFNEAV
jgi:hypothetical protein